MCLAVLVVAACASLTSSKNDYVITGDTCAVYPTEQACDAHSSCEWSGACACPNDEGSGCQCPPPECVERPVDCAQYSSEQACNAQSACEWSPACACPEGTGTGSGSGSGCDCQAQCELRPSGGGSGSGSGSGSGIGSGSGSGSGSAACACLDGGVCFEPSNTDVIECYPPSACPGGCGTPCDEIEGHGTCTLDPNVANLCHCSD
ncbi:MAG TPA: hypothetical protein VMJ10_00075 [Kofleriaceae bacterium]|nr:hypothetical protein [Kofleriaceae bacterium]